MIFNSINVEVRVDNSPYILLHEIISDMLLPKFKNLAKNEEKAVPLQARLQVYIPPKKISKPFRINKIQ